MSHKAPGAAACQSVLKTEYSTDAILCRVEMSTIGTDAPGLKNDTEDMLQEVDLMGSKVIKIASTTNLRLQSPGKRLRMSIVEVAWRYGKAHLHIHRLSYHTLVDDVLHARPSVH